MTRVALGAVAVLCVVWSLPVAAQGQPAELPDGHGKELVQSQCSVCHGVDRITRAAGYSRQAWQDLFGSMVELPEGDAAVVAESSSSRFGQASRPPHTHPLRCRSSKYRPYSSSRRLAAGRAANSIP